MDAVSDSHAVNGRKRFMCSRCNDDIDLHAGQRTLPSIDKITRLLSISFLTMPTLGTKFNIVVMLFNLFHVGNKRCGIV